MSSWPGGRLPLHGWSNQRSGGGRLLAGGLHVSGNLFDKPTDSGHCLVDCWRQPRKRREFTAETDVLPVIRRPDNPVCVEVSSHAPATF